ncbi:hypothetical protein [Streptomyces sp. NBC_01803]|uniref:hypothetical protein n=1 Tax=Streptomyces sp. NBC_01803 TaxID=2975946 RepID=UPI002DD802D7|nr:hypothetical protein [Streptomyces sp. NBC_01803]WSA43806.1 hypothetical protein OIE51_06060 [Streptomyces sp. NBC_01803]
MTSSPALNRRALLTNTWRHEAVRAARPHAALVSDPFGLPTGLEWENFGHAWTSADVGRHTGLRGDWGAPRGRDHGDAPGPLVVYVTFQHQVPAGLTAGAVR